MNVLYCGDKNIVDGLIISVLSLLKNVTCKLNVFCLTMDYENEEKKYEPITYGDILVLEKEMKKYNKDNSIKLINITDIVNECLPEANLNTRFTPYCMLRLYIDKIEEIPSKILYLDNDVVCYKNPEEFYNIDNSNYELVGVLDYYGSNIYRKKVFSKDYINSGVLLLNVDLIKKTHLFEKARNRCRNVKMLLPDQSALNKYCKKKLIVSRIYNEQHQENEDTVFRHFTTTFKFWPKVTTQTIKPWDIDNLHDILKVHTFDDILEKYIELKKKEEK